MNYRSFLLVLCLNYLNASDLRGFDDTVLYDIQWPGNKFDETAVNLEESETITVTTSHDEKYKCILPKIQEKETSTDDNYSGPTAFELISPLFHRSSCSYRLESYWTYEICHGKFIRQYHEDREGKKVKVQEYILGKWDENNYEAVLHSHKEFAKETKAEIPTKKIDNVNLPYLEVNMGNGTLCDLNNNKPRETKVLYVCYIHGKHEVYSLKETSTCQYEIVILSPSLCTHPKYKPKDSGENQINCVPLEGSPDKPYNLLKMKIESAKLRRMSDLDRIRVEFVPLDLSEKNTASKIPELPPKDNTPVLNFLSGKNCLNGGTGWWKYEFCYGKSVEQYHIEKDGSKVSINLGRFDKEKHIEWLEQLPNKRPKPLAQRTQLSHLYSGGTVCDKTGKPRQTEVKLKCLDNAANVNAVSLYLLEPRYCEYILGVESPLICDILAKADENGLVEVDEEVDNDVTITVIKV